MDTNKDFAEVAAEHVLNNISFGKTGMFTIPLTEIAKMIGIEMKKPILCIFHKDCLDGFASAYCVWKQFGADNVEFMALGYEDPVPDLSGRTVYIVDFSFKPELLIPAAEKAHAVYLLDHHKTAIEDWENLGIDTRNVRTILNGKLSGVGIVHQHFHPDAHLPFILACIQDYDLWKFHIRDSRNVVQALYSHDFIAKMDFTWFDQWTSPLANEHSDGVKDLIKRGMTIFSYQRTMAENIIRRNAGRATLQGYDVPIAAMPRELHSLAGQIMAENEPFSVTYEDNLNKGVRTYSLRSDNKDPKAVDVSEVARAYGGGGHRNAAGFTTNVPLMWNDGISLL